MNKIPGKSEDLNRGDSEGKNVAGRNKTNEELIKESVYQYRLLFELSPTGILIEDNNGNILDMNPEFCKIIGYKREELLGRNISIIVPEEYRSEIQKRINFILAGNVLYSIVTNIKKDGSEVFMELRETSFYLPDGTKGILVICNDITERKKAEKALKQSENLYRSLVETSPEGISLGDLDGNLIFINDQKVALFGYENQEELLKKSVYDLIDESEIEKAKALSQELIQKGYINNAQIKFKRKDGSFFYGEIRAKLIYDEKGNPSKIIDVISDITDRKKYLDQLKEAKIKAEESDRLKSAFLANMSHEIRTPLNGILGFAELLKDESITEGQRREFLDIINSSGRQLLNLINDIIDLSKIEAGQIELIETECNINSLLNEVYAFFQSIKKDSGKDNIEFRFKPGIKDAESDVKIDSFRLKQILNNLLSNALKFTHQGYIEFGYRLIDNYLEFYVKDTGIGVPKESMNIIFERFRQADDSHSRIYGGTGLGLSICKALVELMGGDIMLSENEKEGAKFIFRLPYNKVSFVNQEAKKIINEPEGWNWSNKKILVVEDDFNNFLFIRTILKKSGIKILRAENGFDAVEITKNEPDIDLIMMDIQLPKMNGYEATREIRKFNNNICIIAQTAHAFYEDKNKCIAAGCTDYLPKPIEKEMLFAMLEKYLS